MRGNVRKTLGEMYRGGRRGGQNVMMARGEEKREMGQSKKRKTYSREE